MSGSAQTRGVVREWNLPVRARARWRGRADVGDTRGEGRARQQHRHVRCQANTDVADWFIGTWMGEPPDGKATLYSSQ